jgi:hypothetical protein
MKEAGTSRRPPRSPTIEVDDEERGMVDHRDGYGYGAVEARRLSFSSSPSGGRTHRPMNLSDDSSSVNSSDSETLDVVSELAPLVGGNYQHHHHHHQATAAGGLSDDESIHTVTALPDMEIRCHSISSNNAAGRRGNCSIRPSTAKVVSAEHSWSC